ncbi:LTA synthase family protein [Nocardioides daphniae]|uniref:LTA synthase family protein n=1 Tax=Nocardioides daphniae TaxID=402297 RepID=A0A4P7UAL3_9ACTN|nr:LTA synthase family protein [Nocardioides daphniae]QCC76966.1 LTA synthase family protein [Nocardioides daphniae]GGD18228.1 hypothetical protein GCM10007231_16650 [Nocardioides daphniae]
MHDQRERLLLDDADDVVGSSVVPVRAEPDPEADAQPDPEVARRVRLRLRTHLLGVLGVTLVCAVLVDAMFAVSLRLQGFLPLRLGPGLLGLATVWLVVLATFGVLGRLRPTVVVVLTVATGFAVLNGVRMQILNVPLTFGDVVFLKDPAFLVEMVGVRMLVVAVVGLAAVAGVLTLLLRRFGPEVHRVGRDHDRWRWWLTFRVGAVAALLVVGLLASGFNTPGNPLRRAFNETGATWKSWSQTDNYRVNGFVAGLLYNLPVDPMAEPEGYDRAAMEELAQRWQAEADVVNAGTDPDVLAGTNVVVVLSETLGDPFEIDHLTFERDPIPHVRELMTTDGGHMLASFYGSGTSSMEFQVLTGQSLGLFRGQIHAPYQQFVPRTKTFPSAVGWLRSSGHRAVAVHPFRAQMYRRPEVYETFGFQEFVDVDHLQERHSVAGRGFVSDQSAYDEVLHQLQESTDPAFVHLVTMQNHLPFDQRYNETVGVEGTSVDRAERIGQWARGIEHSDRALARFLRQVEASGERTVVVQFGDHYPGIFDMGLLEEEGLNLFRTPFFVWDSEGGRSVGDLGTVSPTAALEVAMRKLGAPLPPWLVLLGRVQEEVGVVRRDSVVTPEGEVVGLDELTSEQEALLADYRMVQYDFAVGERYALADLWYDPQD